MTHLEALHAIADGKKVTNDFFVQPGREDTYFLWLNPATLKIENNDGIATGFRFHDDKVWSEFEPKKTLAQSELIQVVETELSKTTLGSEEQLSVISGISSGLGF